MEFYATLGAACADRETILALFRAGMTGARLNLSHTSLDACAGLLTEEFYPAARAAGVARPHLILDLQGPELRVGALPCPLELPEGGQVLLGPGGIPVPACVVDASRTGQEIALDDSALLLQVEAREPEGLRCRVLRGGVLQSRKSLALLGVCLDTPALTGADLDNLDRAARFGVTHILQPFVRGRADVEAVRAALAERGLDGVQIMAKIENRLARGDLGNAMPLWELPSVQKDIARRCRARGIPFCLVTQLLWSMERRPVPTRAEVCDIYNGVLDGAAALMLTGETAVGRYPVQAMEYLVRTAGRAMADFSEED